MCGMFETARKRVRSNAIDALIKRINRAMTKAGSTLELHKSRKNEVSHFGSFFTVDKLDGFIGHSASVGTLARQFGVKMDGVVIEGGYCGIPETVRLAA